MASHDSHGSSRLIDPVEKKKDKTKSRSKSSLDKSSASRDANDEIAKKKTTPSSGSKKPAVDAKGATVPLTPSEKARVLGSSSKKPAAGSSPKTAALGSGSKKPAAGSSPKTAALGSSSKKPALDKLELRDEGSDDARAEAAAVEREKLELEREKLRLEREQLEAARRALENRRDIDLAPEPLERPVVVVAPRTPLGETAPRDGLIRWATRACIALAAILMCGLALFAISRALGLKSAPVEDRIQDVSNRVNAAIDAATKVPETRPPESSDSQRAETKAKRDIALALAKKAEQEGDLKAAEDALEVADANGAPASEIVPARERIRSRGRDEKDVTAALAQAQKLASSGDLAGALAAAHGAEAAAARIHRGEAVAKLVAKLEADQKTQETVARANEVVGRAQASIDRGELDGAANLLREADGIAPGAETVAAARARLDRFRATPEGTLYLETCGPAANGIYARKSSVTNRELKDWIDTLPPGKRRAGPWLSGDYAPKDAELPVLNVKPDDALAFAQSRGERLPTAAERPFIAKAFGCSPEESGLNARGVLANGFRTCSGGTVVLAEEEAKPEVEEHATARKEKPAVSEKVLETAVATRVKGWLLMRKDLKCQRCHGAAKVKCWKCGGKGTIDRVSFGGDNASDTIPCPECKDYWRYAWEPGWLLCPDCHDGFSAPRMERVKLTYGGGPFPLTEYSERSIVVKLEDGGKRAKVTYDVRYAQAEKFVEESSVWTLDKSGKWANASCYQSVYDPILDWRLRPYLWPPILYPERVPPLPPRK